MLMPEWKLLPSFLRKFKVLEHQFQNLLPTNTVLYQFETFLADKNGIVKHMNEREFMTYIVNLECGEAYKDLVKFLLSQPFWL